MHNNIMAAGSKVSSPMFGQEDINNGDQFYGLHFSLLLQQKQYQNEVNDIRAERIAKSANPLALLAAAQPYSDNYYQAPKPQRSYANIIFTRLVHLQTHRQRDRQTSTPHNPESVSEEDMPQAETRCTLQAEQADWLADTDEEIDEQELKQHYCFHGQDSGECLTPDSSNICNNDNQVDQNATECVDERATLANFLANLTLDTEENKTFLKQLNKAYASLTQEFKECKTDLDGTSREAASCRDSCLIALHNKQNELEKVKISSTNIRLETIVRQKEETFQVVIDLIKNSTYFKAFTISADVPEIFMHQFWYSIKKVQGTDSYEFLLANKKCTVNAEVFRTILDICPRVEGVDFINVLDNNTSLTFLIDLSYKGALYKHTNMFVNHMHQPWRTLAAIINKCLSGKTTNIAYQIDHRKEKRSRRENMPYPRFTKIIINHFLKQHKSLTNLNYQHYHTIKDDGIMFIKYSTGQIRPEKSRGKGSQGKKTADDSQETVDVSEESEHEPELARKKTSSKRRVKKKVTLSVDDNIISDDFDAALELAKSISKTKAEEAEVARKVHATHARIVTESVPESAKKKSSGRSSKSVVIQDTPSAPKSKPATLKTKLKGAQSLTLEEQEAADIMQALKESKKTSKRQPGTGGSSEGTGSKPGVLDEFTVVSATLSEGTGIKLWVPDEENDITEEKVILEWGDEQDSEYSDDDKAILGVKSVSVKKLHGYGHLEEIVVKRSDHQLYKFKEGDFVDLHLNDIKDMLLLVVQHKQFHLDGSDIVDFIVALYMFTRSLILKRHVEDLQLGKRVLRADELYKFSDGTLKSVRDEIHHRVLDFRLDYNMEMPTRKWMAVERKRSGLMIELIDKQLREREIIINLERLVGARELEMDYKLMSRAV
ncbi:hypothetical protein Tco_0892374 [Tanacetum coccineum]|uniref:Uncharacterized protein n=1 Tax=Tanacetum coccineum TaxID=301880 RepID=A0ABQ5C8Q2_9ASTR